MAADKLAVKRHFKDMLVAMRRHRNDLAAYSEKGNAFGVARCKRLLKFNCSRIRKYYAKHDLELPHSVPPEGAE